MPNAGAKSVATETTSWIKSTLSVLEGWYSGRIAVLIEGVMLEGVSPVLEPPLGPSLEYMEPELSGTPGGVFQ